MRRTVVLTGAGISRESGLDTLRDAGGIWSRVRIEDVATPEAFARDPARVHAFYNARRARLAEVQPNAAHTALARLERELDGELRRVRCIACGARPDWLSDTGAGVPCPSCGADRLRPDVVWFGEMPMHMAAIEAALERCDLFVSIGTSGTVYPTAGFVQLARHARTIELDLEPPPERSRFERSIRGPATVTVPALVAGLLGQ